MSTRPLFCLAYFTATSLLFFSAGCEPDTPESKAKWERSRKELDDEVEVSQLSEAAVKQCLKWPLDASFGWFPSVVFNAGRTAAEVKGTVAAKNSFGASLTHEYSVLLIREREAWEVDVVAIGNSIVYTRSETQVPTPTKATSKQKPKRPVVKVKVEVESRTWIDASGEYQIEAEFVSMTAGKVKLKKVDGTTITLPIDKLSEEDRKWIEKRSRR
jgi:hypothetical protein